ALVRRRDYTKPPQDYFGDSKCAGIPRSTEGIRNVRRVHVEVRRQPAQEESLEEHGSNSREDGGVRCDERGFATPRILIRRIDDLLCSHAGSGHGERPPRSLLPIRRGLRGRTPRSRILLGDRTHATRSRWTTLWSTRVSPPGCCREIRVNSMPALPRNYIMRRRAAIVVGTYRIFFVSDLHGSEVCFRKFINSADAYHPDLLIYGGDILGKILVPIFEEGRGSYHWYPNGEKKIRFPADDLPEVERQVADQGRYTMTVTPDGWNELRNTPGKLEAMTLELGR